jgi:hypothetical protein
MGFRDSRADTSALVASLHYIVADIYREYPHSAKVILAAALELEALRRAGSMAEARAEYALPPLRGVVSVPDAANGNGASKTR